MSHSKLRQALVFLLRAWWVSRLNNVRTGQHSGGGSSKILRGTGWKNQAKGAYTPENNFSPFVFWIWTICSFLNFSFLLLIFLSYFLIFLSYFSSSSEFVEGTSPSLNIFGWWHVKPRPPHFRRVWAAAYITSNWLFLEVQGSVPCRSKDRGTYEARLNQLLFLALHLL